MGHAGTLDPLASGLMIIGVNEGTKRMEEFLKLPKSYEAEILLGTRTDTGDLEGEVIDTAEVYDIDEDYVREVVNNFVGVFELPVPAYSAVKRGGKKLYELAREGKDIELPIRSMEVHKSVFKKLAQVEDYYILSVMFDVASGVYIRSLVEHLGSFLDIPATLANLRRIKIGGWHIKDARPLK